MIWTLVRVGATTSGHRAGHSLEGEVGLVCFVTDGTEREPKGGKRGSCARRSHGYAATIIVVTVTASLCRMPSG